MAKTYKMKQCDQNIVIIQGRVGSDPKWKEVGEGLVTFSVATSERWKDKSGEWQEKTEWHNVAVFGKNAGYLNDKIKKGGIVLVKGSISSNKKDDRVYTSIKPDPFGGVKVVASAEDDGSQPAASVVDEDDLPF